MKDRFFFFFSSLFYYEEEMSNHYGIGMRIIIYDNEVNQKQTEVRCFPQQKKIDTYTHTHTWPHWLHHKRFPR